MKVSIVIPTRNEELNLPDILRGCLGKGDEVLVVDGHSTDKTREIAENMGARVVLDNGPGQGGRFAGRPQRGHR